MASSTQIQDLANRSWVMGWDPRENEPGVLAHDGGAARAGRRGGREGGNHEEGDLAATAGETLGGSPPNIASICIALQLMAITNNQLMLFTPHQCRN
jgi:hypothetical protein